MEIGKNNNSQNIPEYKTPDDIDIKQSQVYKPDKIANVLSGIEQAVERDIASAIENDGVIDSVEKKHFKKLV